MRPGITEIVWKDRLKEETRQKWGLTFAVLTAVAAFFIKQTPYLPLNCVIKVYLVVNAYLLIQPQRTYSRLERSFQRKYARASFLCATIGVSVLVSAFFIAPVLAMAASMVKAAPNPFMKTGAVAVYQWFVLLTMGAALFTAAYRAYHGMNVRDFVVKVPRLFFYSIIFRRTFAARTFLELAFIEISVIAYNWAFASIAASVTKMLHDALQIT